MEYCQSINKLSKFADQMSKQLSDDCPFQQRNCIKREKSFMEAKKTLLNVPSPPITREDYFLNVFYKVIAYFV